MKEATLKISREEAEQFRALFNVDHTFEPGDESILDKYGVDSDWSDTYEVLFDNGAKGYIHLWMDGELYSEGSLVKDGSECCLTDAESEIEGDWNLVDDDGEQYVIHVEVKE